MENKALLKAKGIPKELWTRCYVKDGQVFLPNDTQTGEEVYQAIQSKIDICPTKTTEERLNEIDTAIENLQAMYFEILMEV